MAATGSQVLPERGCEGSKGYKLRLVVLVLLHAAADKPRGTAAGTLVGRDAAAAPGGGGGGMGTVAQSRPCARRNAGLSGIAEGAATPLLGPLSYPHRPGGDPCPSHPKAYRQGTLRVCVGHGWTRVQVAGVEAAKTQDIWSPGERWTLRIVQLERHQESSHFSRTHVAAAVGAAVGGSAYTEHTDSGSSVNTSRTSRSSKSNDSGGKESRGVAPPLEFVVIELERSFYFGMVRAKV